MGLFEEIVVEIKRGLTEGDEESVHTRGGQTGQRGDGVVVGDGVVSVPKHKGRDTIVTVLTRVMVDRTHDIKEGNTKTHLWWRRDLVRRNDSQ